MSRALALIPLLGALACSSCQCGPPTQTPDAAVPLTPPSGRVLPDGTASPECLASAAEAAAAAAGDAGAGSGSGSGASAVAGSRAYQAELTRCLSPLLPAEVALVAGRVALDTQQAARRVVRALADDGGTPVEDYLALLRDRTRKLHRVELDRPWADAIAAHDDDFDLVPEGVDGGDACPGTPELTPTDERGCPDARRPAAPDRRLLTQVLNNLGVYVSPACDGAPLPNAIRPLTVGYGPSSPGGLQGLYAPAAPCVRESNSELCHDGVDNDCDGARPDEGCPLAGQPRFETSVTRVSNQPAGCMVLYELELWLSESSSPPRFAPLVRHLVFRDFEGTVGTGTASNQIQFTLPLDATPAARHDVVDGLWKYDRVRWRVRAMNGNGFASPWSELVDGTPENTRE